MERLLRFKKYILFIVAVAWMLAIAALVICQLYSNRHWNEEQFRTFYACSDFAAAYTIEAIVVLVFFILFIVLMRKQGGLPRTIIRYSTFAILCCCCLAVPITLIANTIGLSDVINNYGFDKQLESEDPNKFNEAVEELIKQARAGYFNLYMGEHPNQYILKAARANNPKAQNAIGCIYHELAKSQLCDAEKQTDLNIQQRIIAHAESDFDSAIYWFLKAAQNGYAVSQTNLGRIFMGDLASNRAPDTALATQWLIKAADSGDANAYLYLGRIFADSDLREAYVYWKKGADSGDEACVLELEKPEFAMGIPADRGEAVLSDSCPVAP